MSRETQGALIKPMGRFAEAIAAFRQPLQHIPSIKPNGWWSPGQPIKPFAPPGTQPKAFQFFSGMNQIFTPRPDGEYTAKQLKQLATYDLVRVIVENVKDQVARCPRNFRIKAKPGESNKDRRLREKNDEVLFNLARFFEYPDGENDWSTWVSSLVEDMLVIDAPATLVRRTYGGTVAELRVLRGESICRYIDENGFTPRPPFPAYAQVFYGAPICDFTTKQLVYRPRRIVPRASVTSNLYGMSAVEQVAQFIRIGSSRLNFTEEYYKSGSIPGVVQVVPPEVSPEKIAEAMQWMNSELAGNLAARQQWRMVQGFQQDGKKDQIIFSKEALLADPFDDLLIRCLCFGFGTSPQRLQKMMNRASARESNDAAELEGLMPYLDWVQAYINYIIFFILELPDYEVTFQPHVETDIIKQANSDAIKIRSARNSINELREAAGEDPRPEPEADKLGIISGSGWTEIGKPPIVAPGTGGGVATGPNDRGSKDGKPRGKEALDDTDAGGKRE